MRETIIVFVCDRCGRRAQRDADRNIAEEELPMRWRRVNIDGNQHYPRESFELCDQCQDALDSFLKLAQAES